MTSAEQHPPLWDEPEEREQYNPKLNTKLPPSGNLLSSKDSGTSSFVHYRSTVSEKRKHCMDNRQRRSLLSLMHNSLVVGQEFTLACLLLVRHRDIIDPLPSSSSSSENWRQVTSLSLMVITFAIILYHSEVSKSQLLLLETHQQRNEDQGGESISSNGNKEKVWKRQNKQRRKKMLVRLVDCVILASILRLLSSVLRSLTASYSSDTVTVLAVVGLIVHLLTCDYRYANGYPVGDAAQSRAKKKSMNENDDFNDCNDSGGREKFLGGTLSLNAALFSTTLLSSRLPSSPVSNNGGVAESFAFVSTSVVLFAFYPAARHAISAVFIRNSVDGDGSSKGLHTSFVVSPCLIITLSLSFSTFIMLRGSFERIMFLFIIFSICLLSPTLKWWLQQYKTIISGPWDIAHIVLDE